MRVRKSQTVTVGVAFSTFRGFSEDEGNLPSQGIGCS
jgi:hypothetical protein